MGLPSMVGFGLGNIYYLVDMYWLSRLGPEPVAAVTILGSALWVMSSANTIVGVGSVAIISRRYGEKDYVETERAIKETIILKWISAIFIGILGYVLTPFIMDILGAEGDVQRLGVIYGRIIFLGLGFYFSTYSVFTALRGVGNPMMAMVLMIMLNVLNAGLDPLLIFGIWIFPEMGIAGAALASVISNAVTFCIGLGLFYIGRANVRLRIRSRQKIRISTMLRILKIGVPAAIGDMSFSTARMIIMPMIAAFGTGVVAAYGVGLQVSALGIHFLVGIGLGLSALMGQIVGAGKLDRARQTVRQAFALTIGIKIVLGIVTVIFAADIMRIFFDEAHIVEYGVPLMRILALSFPFLAMHFIMEFVYVGVGENRPPMVFNMIHSWAFEIPAVYIATQVFEFGHIAIWWAITGATIATVIIFYIYFRKEKWLYVKV
jgi:putative MATE family efflux protein